MVGMPCWNALNARVHSRSIPTDPAQRAPGIRLSYNRALPGIFSGLGFWGEYTPFNQTVRQNGEQYNLEARDARGGLSYKVYLLGGDGHYLAAGGGINGQRIDQSSTFTESGDTLAENLQEFRLQFDAGVHYNYGSLNLFLHGINLSATNYQGTSGLAYPVFAPRRYEAEANYYFLTLFRSQLIPRARYSFVDESRYENATEPGPQFLLLGGRYIYDNFLLLGAAYQPELALANAPRGVVRQFYPEWTFEAGLLVLGRFRLTYQYLQTAAGEVSSGTEFTEHRFSLQINW